MSTKARRPIVLLAEDDSDDRLIIRSAWAASNSNTHLKLVSDGDELLDYLYGRGSYSLPKSAPQPDLIILDIDMPRISGFEVLEHIKKDPAFTHIPVLMLTTSGMEHEILKSYELGASAFIIKPASFDKFVEMINMLNKYWFHVVTLPPHSKSAPKKTK